MALPAPGRVNISDSDLLSALTAAPDFSAIEQEIANQKPPTPEPVPATPTPLAAFLAAFGGSLGSSLTRNPDLYRSSVGAYEERVARRNAIEARNAALSREFQTGQQSTRLNVLMRRAEIEQARKGAGFEAALRERQGIAEDQRRHGFTMEEIGARNKGELDQINARTAGEKAIAKFKIDLKQMPGVGDFTKEELAELNRAGVLVNTALDAQLGDRFDDLGNRIPPDPEVVASALQSADKYLSGKVKEIRDRRKPKKETVVPAPQGGGMGDFLSRVKARLNTGK